MMLASTPCRPAFPDGEYFDQEGEQEEEEAGNGGTSSDDDGSING